MIGRYALVRELGRSPHALTTLRTDTESGARCVLKSLDLGEVDDLKVIEMFRREARVLRGLDHPGIPRLLDTFEEKAEKRFVLHLVQEYVEGENLAEARSRRGSFAEREVIAIARELIAILRYLHSFSPPIIHRDLKPENVILSRDGAVHLIDFSGVRDTIRQDRDVEGAVTVVGSYGYMPFEQYEGRAFPASDVYALGMTLTFLSTGRGPADLDRDGMRLLVPDDAAITPRFRSVLERMIEPDVEKRFQSVDEVERALPAEPAARRPPSRGVTLAGLGVALAGLLVALVVLRERPADRASQGESRAARPPAVAPRPTPAPSAATSPRVEPAWTSHTLTPPDPDRAKLVAQGLITYGAQPLQTTIAPTPELKVWSEAARGYVEVPMRYANSTVELFDLEPGKYTIWAHWWDGESRYSGGQEIRVEASRVVQFEFHMMRMLQMAAIEGAERREGFCELAAASPVVVAWKPLDEGTYYDYDVYENRCDGKARAVAISSGSTRATSLRLELPASRPGMRYQVNVGARRSGTWIGSGGVLFAVVEAESERR